VSSICFLSYGLKTGAWVSPRIVVGTVVEKGSFRFPGSERVSAPPEGTGFPFLRIRTQRALKGPEARAGEELRVFSSMDWFRHEQADALRGGIISYVDARYSEALPLEQVAPGIDVLVFLSEDPVPSEYPAGAVFEAFGQAVDRADRAEEVLAMLREGPPGDFDQEIRLQQGRRVRFPDGLEIAFLSHSDKPPRAAGPQKEWVDLGLAKDSYRGTIRLDHDTDENQNESWEARRWHNHSVELKAMPDGAPVVVVRRAP
jgi:hypothetical protein